MRDYSLAPLALLFLRLSAIASLPLTLMAWAIHEVFFAFVTGILGLGMLRVYWVNTGTQKRTLPISLLLCGALSAAVVLSDKLSWLRFVIPSVWVIDLALLLVERRSGHLPSTTAGVRRR